MWQDVQKDDIGSHIIILQTFPSQNHLCAKSFTSRNQMFNKVIKGVVLALSQRALCCIFMITIKLFFFLRLRIMVDCVLWETYCDTQRYRCGHITVKRVSLFEPLASGRTRDRTPERYSSTPLVTGHQEWRQLDTRLWTAASGALALVRLPCRTCTQDRHYS